MSTRKPPTMRGLVRFMRRVAKRILRRADGGIESQRALIVESGLFDPKWYLDQYPEVRTLCIDPVRHYLETGWREGKNPSPNFDTEWYLAINKDVARANLNPLVHYITDGKAEYRAPQPPAPMLEKTSLDDVDISGVSVSEFRSVVAVHLHYPDLADEMLTPCLNVPGHCDILVSTTSRAGEEAAEAWRARTGCKRLTVRQSKNRGRNVACYTVVFRKELAACDVFCHVHGKKSLYAGVHSVGHSWRQHNVKQLLGSPEHVQRIFAILKHDPSLGIVSPVPNPDMTYAAFTRLSNARSEAQLAQITGVPLGFDGYFDYPLGNMFWARPKAIAQLLDGRINYESFPEEKGQNDGTLAHAIERSILFLARANGFGWIEINAETNGYNHGWSERNFFQYELTKTVSSFSAAIDSAKTVSFDIFDTLITRILPKPHDLYGMVENALDADQPTRTEFRRHRLAAESALRLAKNDSDVGYDEIYERLKTDPETKRFADDAHRLEEDMEVRVTIPRTRVVAALNEALRKGKRVILASDMYLHRRQVERLLEKAGVRGYHEMYLSSETNLRKDDNSLWHHLIEKENATDPSFLHIGDNEHSDMQLPTDLGIRTYHVMSPRNLFEFTPLGYRMRRAGGVLPLSLGPTIASICNDPFQGRD